MDVWSILFRMLIALALVVALVAWQFAGGHPRAGRGRLVAAAVLPVVTFVVLTFLVGSTFRLGDWGLVAADTPPLLLAGWLAAAIVWRPLDLQANRLAAVLVVASVIVSLGAALLKFAFGDWAFLSVDIGWGLLFLSLPIIHILLRLCMVTMPLSRAGIWIATISDVVLLATSLLRADKMHGFSQINWFVGSAMLFGRDNALARLPPWLVSTSDRGVMLWYDLLLHAPVIAAWVAIAVYIVVRRRDARALPHASAA